MTDFVTRAVAFIQLPENRLKHLCLCTMPERQNAKVGDCIYTSSSQRVKYFLGAYDDDQLREILNAATIDPSSVGQVMLIEAHNGLGNTRVVVV